MTSEIHQKFGASGIATAHDRLTTLCYFTLPGIPEGTVLSCPQAYAYVWGILIEKFPAWVLELCANKKLEPYIYPYREGGGTDVKLRFMWKFHHGNDTDEEFCPGSIVLRASGGEIYVVHNTAPAPVELYSRPVTPFEIPPSSKNPDIGETLLSLYADAVREADLTAASDTLQHASLRYLQIADHLSAAWRISREIKTQVV